MSDFCLWLIDDYNQQVRKKVPQPPSFYDNKPHYTSEPYLSDETDAPIPHQHVRRGSQRRTAQSNQSTYVPGNVFRFFYFVFVVLIAKLLIVSPAARRKSNAHTTFLDVPGANSYNNNDDTVTLRTFSASNKGS